MLIKLQRKTLVVTQIIGYALTICVGFIIVLLITQFYFDIQPLISKQTDIFKSKTAVITKNISVFKTINKEKIYFTEKEIHNLKEQPFTKDISKFMSANFKIKAFSNNTESVPVFYTDLFFESIPNNYIDVETDDWKWGSSLDFIPIIIPENYLNLYNFGFAESQGLPVLSKNTISQIEFFIEISGNKKLKKYKSKIVGFSNKVNSILVPEMFLLWANKEFGRVKENKTSRVLIEFINPSDKNILEYFNKNNFSINKDKLEFSKIGFFFKSALLFVFAIALVIIFLSIAFILLSLNLIIQRNKELILNLYNIGYNYNRIAKFYQVFITLVTVTSVVTSLIISNIIRNYYLKEIVSFFDFNESRNYLLILSLSFILILTIIYNLIILKNIKKIVIQ